MEYRAPFPMELETVEYAKLYFHLEFIDSFILPPLGLMQLRRELFQALKSLQEREETAVVQPMRELLQPGLSADPFLRRQVQKPSPAFALSPNISQEGPFSPKQKLILPVLFVAAGIHLIEPFVRLLHEMGRQGLYHNRGQFVLEGIESENPSGLPAMLWMRGEAVKELTPPVSDLAWWLERQKPVPAGLQLEILSPLRLVHQGKPLFKVGFSDLFPFIMRRVTSLLAYHAGVEPVENPGRMIAFANKIQETENCLRWRDWRSLKKVHEEQSLGGLMGHMKISGTELSELLWILQLGSLLNFGKGAAYGAGQYRLISIEC